MSKLKIHNSHPKLDAAIIHMITSRTGVIFYSEFFLYIHLKEDNSIKTLAVTINNKNEMLMLWNREFVERTPINQLIFGIIHEMMHLLSNHIERCVNLNRKLSNLAQDMIINHIIYEDIISRTNDKNLIKIIQNEDGVITIPMLPKEYNGLLIFESLYKWLKDEHENYQNNGNKKGDFSIPGKNTKNDMICYPKEYFFENLEDNDGMFFDFHFSSYDVPNNSAKEHVKDVLNKLRNRGLVSSNVEQVLNKIIIHKKDKLKYIKREFDNSIIGYNKEKVITRPNRKDIFGLKGKKKFGVEINCILDTSFSMISLHEKILGYIFKQDIVINLIQIDTEVKSIDKIKNYKELKKLKIKGYGGTTLSPALDYISKNRLLNKNTNLILTDGYTDVLNFSGIKKKSLVLSYKKVIFKNNKNNVKQIIIDENE